MNNILLHETANSLLYLRQEQGYDAPVVVKILKAEYPGPQRIIQFNNEYEFTKNLDLPGIRKAYATEKRDGKYTLLLEYVEAETLRDAFIRQRQPLDVFLKTAARIAEALRQVHEQGIIHRDITPNNILVNLQSGEVNPANGGVKIIDFGLSSKIDLKTRHLGNPDKLEGTLAYLSPEQSGRMNRITDYRTDFYSLGVTFYEILAGCLPFDAKDSLELVHCHIAKTPLPLHEVSPDVPVVLSRIVARLMAKNAEDRYQSALGLKKDLERCLQSLTFGGKVEDFEIGTKDFSGKFQIPQKLYGREEETAALLQAFGRAAGGALELMLVSGYSGVGKSALVHEIHKPVTEKRGWFISGKYDQYQRNVPYFAIRQAFNEYYDLLLTEKLETLSLLKERILEAVGTNAAVLFDVMPHLELMLGEQPPVEQLEAQEAAARFNLVFQKFLRVIAGAEHPLVMFIDDLQWADNASLQLLQTLLSGEPDKHLLLIGAYRDNETDPTHPLMLMLDVARKAAAVIHEIHLLPLSFANVQRLIADAFGNAKYEVQDVENELQTANRLAELVFSKTGGNAFFTVRFLKSLEERGLQFFDLKRQKWQAKTDDIRRLEITGNVVHLMADKIGSMSPESQEALKLAACIGNRFELKMLSLILEKSQPATLLQLWKAVEEGLIAPKDETYKLLAILDEEGVAALDVEFYFLHDRVQQAAYSLIEAGQRSATHLHIGRLLLKNAGENPSEHIFDIVNQLNTGRELISGEAEKIRLAGLNLLAGKRAKDASAFAAALNYLGIGLEMLGDDGWQSGYPLALALHKNAAEAEYLNGNLDASEKLIAACLEHVQTNAEKADIYYLLMLRQALSSQNNEAIETARKGLILLGFELPESDLEQHIGANMGWLIQWFETNGIDSIFEHADLSDPAKLATLKILDNLSMPTYVGGHVNLWILHVLLKVRLSIESGNAPETGYAFSELGLIFCILGNFTYAFPSGDLSRRLVERFERQSLRHKSRAFHLIANYISPWRMHYRDTEPLNAESYRCGMESGEVIFVGYTLFHPFYNHFFVGNPPLATLLERLPASTSAAKKIRHDLAYNSLRAMRMFVLNLLDSTGSETVFEDETLGEARFLQECAEGKDYYSIGTYWVYKAKILHLYGRTEEAWQALEQAKPMLAALSGNAAGISTFTYTQALTMLALYDQASPEDQATYLETAKAHRSQFETWAANCPANFEHKLLLIRAEIARLEGREFEAIGFYNEAIASAAQHGYIHDEALANELTARFLLFKGAPHYALPHLLDARLGYLRWGAMRKVRLLEAQYPTHFAQKLKGAETGSFGSGGSLSDFFHTGSPTRSEELDFISIIKASQAFSGEIVLERLLQKLLTIVLENAGAQKAVLVLQDNGRWQIEATGSAEGESSLRLGAHPDEGEHLPAAVFHVAVNTKKLLVLDHLARETRFALDPYVVRHRPKSALAMPLMHQGQLIGVLYLENSLTSAAFTAGRVNTLHLLSSQMAVSIHNAQLYERTNELNQAYARFVPRQFLKTLGKESILDVRVGDQAAQQMTVLFSDIRDYTGLSESMTPEENFNFINGYLRRISPSIARNGGFINQFYGDGIMALFADPGNAVNAAVGMQLSLREYNVQRSEQARKLIKMGIGIHTGALMMGIIGDSERHDVGVISDVVNAASRLEGLTKQFGVSILISEDTLAGVGNPGDFSYRYLGKVRVKGREGILPVYEFFDGDSEQGASLKRESAALFRQALGEYFNKQFAEAALYLKKILNLNPADRVAEHYLKRAARYLMEGVTEDWTGVERMEEK